MPKLLYEVMDLVSKQKAKADKIKVLKENSTPALRDFLRGSMDDTIQWLVPDGTPPYTPCDPHNTPSTIFKQTTQLRYIVKGGPGEKMSSLKRETIFIGMLESIDPGDALLLIDMINKKQPKGITRPIIEEAFPGLLAS